MNDLGYFDEPIGGEIRFIMADGSIPVADSSGSTHHKAWQGATIVRRVTVNESEDVQTLSWAKVIKPAKKETE